MNVTYPSLIELFNGLATPLHEEGKNLYAAAVVLPYERFHLGKDSQGFPTLLIKMDDSRARHPPAPIHLQHLFVAHNLECEIHRQATVESGLFTVISCLETDRPMELYFLRVLQALLPTIGENPNPKAVNAAVDKLVELFQALKNPPRKTTQGLWSELLVIAESANMELLINAWHTAPEDLYDFNAGSCRIEVKSSSGQTRMHHFSLAQLSPPSGTQMVVASVMANRAGAGCTIADLVNEISSKLKSSPENIFRLYQIIALTLGESWRQSNLEAFDRQAARQSLAFYGLSEIPSVDKKLPDGVSNVHFTADLTGKKSLTYEELRRLGGLFSVLQSSLSRL